MSEILKKATIEAITVKDLLYYDEDKQDDLLRFCFRNNISFLPAKDRQSVYEVCGDRFVHKNLDDNLCIDPKRPLFSMDTFQDFQRLNRDDIFFVCQQQGIIGVVHIVDYNNEFVSVELYRSLYRFENSLRRLLVNNGYSNADFIDWVYREKLMASNLSEASNDYWDKKIKELLPEDEVKRERVEAARASSFPFQTFYFSDLLKFSVEVGLLMLDDYGIRTIMRLRNFTAHNRHYIDITESNEGQLIYNMDGLETFIKSVLLYIDISRQLEEVLNAGYSNALL